MYTNILVDKRITNFFDFMLHVQKYTVYMSLRYHPNATQTLHKYYTYYANITQIYTLQKYFKESTNIVNRCYTFTA